MSNDLRPEGATTTSVDNALWLLQLVGERQALRVAEAADLLGVARSTAHRLLTALRRRGFVMQDRPNGAYRPGPALYEIGLAAVSRIDIVRVARPVLVMRPAHASAVGKAILAGLPDAELDRRYPGAELPPATTSAAVTSTAALRAELAEIRTRGYALNWEESSDGVCAVAVALRDTVGQPLAGLGVAAPSSRIGARDGIRAFAPFVQRGAELVQERLRSPH
jgi:IclR family transcriptional regulator, acetate operon repressor